MTNEQGICLALDTALDACSVGLAISSDGDRTKFSRSLDLGRGHAEHLMSELDLLLKEAGLGYQDLTRLAVTKGPGSFTGLRVGLATARSFSLALGIPLIGFSTLKAMELTARDRGHKGVLAAAIDARRNQIYGQIFVPDMASDPAALSASDFADQLHTYENPTLIGSGGQLVLDAVGEATHYQLIDLTVPDMAVLACYALDEMISDQKPSPLYLRAPDAKPQASKAIARA